MKEPPHFIHPHFPNHVFHLKKFIYGLKQAPHAWFHRFSSFFISQGLVCSKVDSSIFVYHRQSTILIILLYVDAMLVIGNDLSFLFCLLILL